MSRRAGEPLEEVADIVERRRGADVAAQDGELLVAGDAAATAALMQPGVRA